MARTPRKRPNELTPDWPSAPSSTPAGENARLLAVRLREVIGERSVRSVAADAGMDHNTLLAILSGRTWGDMETISKLEHSLGVMLWTYLLPPMGDEPKGIRYRVWRTDDGSAAFWSDTSTDH